MRRQFLSAILLLASTCCFSQQDSIIIKGRIANLTGRLYREAPVITFSRNNILQPQSELSRNAPLQADGSFRVSLPLVFPSEEIYLDYGGKVFTTFLAQPGEIEVSFDADSIFKSRRLFKFGGVNAETNNLYPEYLEEENRLFEKSKHLGADFFKAFWGQGLQSAKQDLLERGNLRLKALANLAGQGKSTPELTNWIKSLVEDEQATLLMEYSLATETSLSSGDDQDLRRIMTSPLTSQKTTRMARFREYAENRVYAKALSSSRNPNALPVETIARLVRRYVKPLEQSELDKLNLIIEKKNADKVEMDFLGNLYKKGGNELTVLANFEKNINGYRQQYEGPAREYLEASALTGNFYQYPTASQKAIAEHLDEAFFNRFIKLSLKELLALETAGSDTLQAIVNSSPGSTPKEVLPGIFIAESEENGKTWLDRIQKMYAGHTIYIINWDLYQDKSRRDLASMELLRQNVPSDVVFLYLHVSDPDRVQSSDYGINEDERKLWKQYIVRHRLKGTHLFLNSLQLMQLGLRFQGIPGTYYLIKPNGKFHSRNAPSPERTADAVKAINAARNG